MSKIVIVCGGTGGHLAPGIALAEELEQRGHECLLLISQKQVDSALTQKYPQLNFRKIPGRAFAGGIGARIQSVGSIVANLAFARRLIRREQPKLVFLFGGFLSVGFGLAARAAGVPIVLHEANCRPGRAVRLVQRLADRIYLPEGLALRGCPRSKIRHYGYPVRRDIRHSLKTDAWRRLKIEVPNKLLVVIGGSQGAKALNDWVVRSFPELAAAGISVYCVTGLGKSATGKIEAVSEKGETIAAYFVPFSEQMGDVISSADLIVSRAGAGAIAEIIRCRAPAILVPYPFAADDHQTANARMHEQFGAGMLLEESRLDRLTEEVRHLMYSDFVLSRFKANMVRLDRFDSAKLIASDIESLCYAPEEEEGAHGPQTV